MNHGSRVGADLTTRAGQVPPLRPRLEQVVADDPLVAAGEREELGAREEEHAPLVQRTLLAQDRECLGAGRIEVFEPHLGCPCVVRAVDPPVIGDDEILRESEHQIV